MQRILAQAWPNGVPQTLWNYRLMQAEDLPLLPLTGLKIEAPFALAFGFGVAFIAVFARQRFKQSSFDIASQKNRVVKELAPVDLRGPSAMNRAYLIYVGILLAVYLLMTFFGKVILETAGKLPIAGIEVDASSLNFSSPQWPLLLAFGFAGLAPMIKPLEIVETWLRRWTHHVVGIPVKIEDNTRKLLRALRREPTAVAVPRWIPVYLGRWEPIERVLMIREELEDLLRWTKDDNTSWPSSGVRDRIARIEETVAAESKSVLQDFAELLEQDYYNAPPTRGAEASGSSDKPGDEAVRLHQKRLELHLTAIIGRMEELRDEYASILAVYAERDPDFTKIGEPKLRTLMLRTLAVGRVRGGPEFGLLACLVPVFAAYALACTFSVHPLLYPVALTPVTVLATAALETLRVASVLLLPAVAAFALRQNLLDKDEWVPRAGGDGARLLQERLAAILVGWLVATACLILLSALWVAVFAENLAHFQEVLFRGRTPFILFYPTQSALAVPFLLFSLLAADADPKGAALRRTILGLLSAASMAGLLALHMFYWYQGAACTRAAPGFLRDLFALKDCFAYYGGLDFFVYPLMAFLAATVFGARPPAPVDTQPLPQPGSGGSAGQWVASVAALGIVLAAILHGGAAFGQSTATTDATRITLGFRADAEPFSFRYTADDKTRYMGYVADLCYAIFAGSDYIVKSVEVTAEDRFERLRKPAVNGRQAASIGAAPIDVLCDPVTIRFSDPERYDVGVYSPIVFTSGVSYLSRRTRSANMPTYLGFVTNSTARDVVERACEVDLLRVKPGERCPAAGARIEACPPPDQAPARTNPRYLFCQMPSHDDLVKWFCTRPREGDTQLPVRVVYFGDRDLIMGKIRSWRALGNPCPAEEIEEGVGNLTYEPYALIVTAANPALVMHVQRRVYEFFSHQSDARSLFMKYFPDQQMSSALAYLFLLNGVEQEDQFQRPGAMLASEAPSTERAAAALP